MSDRLALVDNRFGISPSSVLTSRLAHVVLGIGKLSRLGSSYIPLVPCTQLNQFAFWGLRGVAHFPFSSCP